MPESFLFPVHYFNLTGHRIICLDWNPAIAPIVNAGFSATRS